MLAQTIPPADRVTASNEVALMRAPSVSVVVIFLNAEKFLREAVESVLAQTFGDWELLLVDDGSTDGSSAMARRLAEHDPHRTRYFEHEGHRNRGMSASRNLGMQFARGEFIAFLDADDVWVPTKLAEQVALMRAQPRAAMVFGRTRYWHGWTGRPEDAARDRIRRCAEREDVLLRPPYLLRLTLLGDGSWPSPSMSSIMLRREKIARIGGFEEAFTGQGEDSVFLAKLFLESYVYCASACWDWYRQHPASNMARVEREGHTREGNRQFLEWLGGFLASRPVRDPELATGVKRGLEMLSHPVLARLRPAYLARKVRQYARRHVSEKGRARLRQAAHMLRRPWLWLVRTARLRWLWRTRPVHREFGCYYGTPVDRVYIEAFLEANAGDIQGTVLEIGEATYTRRFGGERVAASEVLHAIPGNPAATVVADLVDAPQLPSNHFDCVILTQTLQCIYDYKAALRTVHRILKPGGVVLATFPGVAHQISREERPYWGDYWRWTSMAAERVFAEVFAEEDVQVRARGNVLTAMAFLHGLVVEELRRSDFDYEDPDYELSIAVRAVKR